MKFVGKVKQTDNVVYKKQILQIKLYETFIFSDVFLSAYSKMKIAAINFFLVC